MNCKLFVDTMVFLHYRPLNELDLPSLLGSDQLTIVVPRITLRELDKHKSTHSSRKVRDRARNVLAALDAAISSKQPLPGGLAVEFWRKDPTETLSRFGLNSNWNDDLLVASAHLYRESSDDAVGRVVVLTQDTGPRLTCRDLNLETAQLDESLRLPDDLEPLEQENRELSRELQRFKNARPCLSVGFVNSGGAANATFDLTPSTQVDEEMIQRDLNELRGKYPHLSEPLPRKVDSAKHPFENLLAATKASMVAKSMNAIPKEEYERYNRGVDAYLTKYQQFLRLRHEYSGLFSRTIEFQIQIQNNGTAPADDVDVHFHFPNGFVLYAEAGIPQNPQPPNPPKKPRTRWEGTFTDLGRIDAGFPLKLPNIELPTSFEIRQTNSYDVTDHFRRIKHGVPEILPTMYAEFPGYAEARSFHCAYELRPANLTEAVTGQLHFIIEKHDN